MGLCILFEKIFFSTVIVTVPTIFLEQVQLTFGIGSANILRQVQLSLGACDG